MRTQHLILLSTAVLFVVRCGDTSTTAQQHKLVQLQPLSNCTDVEQTLREAARNEMRNSIEKQRANMLQHKLNSQYCYGYDEASRSSGIPPMSPSQGQSSPQPNASPSGGVAVNESDNSSGANQYSTTNNQEVGVDEADFIKNDSKHIYLVNGNTFRIIAAWPADKTHELSRIIIEGQPKKLFVHQGRAVVYSSLTLPQNDPFSPYDSEGDASANSVASQNECTYGYQCQFTGDGRSSKLTVIDLKNTSAPKVTREFYFSGSYLNARRIENAVYTVVSAPPVQFSGLKYSPVDDKGNYLNYCDPLLTVDQIDKAFDRLIEDNERTINTTQISALLPNAKEVRYDDTGKQDSKQLMSSCQGYYRDALLQGKHYTTVMAFDLADQSRPAKFSTIVSAPGAVYASDDALYLAVPQQYNEYGDWYATLDSEQEATNIHKFALDSKTSDVAYTASGVVKGRILNQFSLDQHEAHLRIATTSGHIGRGSQTGEYEAYNTIHVLRQNGNLLWTTGMVDHMAPNEDIRSVRFAGERGFVVTFKKTDPLFVLDLANPYNPKVLAELKIPGFSTYMQLMDPTHLLTIGYDADDQGSFAWFQGVMLQIFDITNPSDPKLAHKEIIGTRGSSSEALTNHLAFNYFAPKNLLALPMTVCEGGSSGGSYGDQMTFSGLMVYDVTAINGFKLRGKVQHEPGPNATCSNWWTDASSQVQRSIIMDDYVFSISDTRIKVNHLNALSKDTVDLSL